nr:hypothetical protein [uncultured Campylobacter sp.]
MRVRVSLIAPFIFVTLLAFKACYFMLFSIFIFFKFLGFGKSHQKNIYLNQRHYLNKFDYENIKNKKSQNNAQIALKLT